ncbi:MAG: protein kinase [Tahibacter sp.]
MGESAANADDTGGASAATLAIEPPRGAGASTPAHIGPYAILRLLGQGGMGRVYLAQELQPTRQVALKVVSSLGGAALLRFRREAELLAQLEHSGIARLYATGEDLRSGIGVPWLAMEYVEGRDLIHHARETGMPLAERLHLLIAICRAIHFAHGRGVIHRDLKPGNILVDAQGQPKILDFGIARLREDDAMGMTQAGQILGTVPYMSPEQLSGSPAAIDVRSDLYSLGVIAYELIGGQLPHPQLSTSTLFAAVDIVRNETPATLASIAPAARGDLDTVVMQALDVAPERRYASVAEFAADLERVLDHRPVDARPPTVTYLGARFIRRHRVVSAAAVLVALALVVASVVSLRYAWSEAVARRDADARAAEAAAVNRFLERMLTSADPEKTLGRDLTVHDVLDAAAEELAKAALTPATEASLSRTLGATYLKLGDAARADLLYTRALNGSATLAPGESDGLVLGHARALLVQAKYAEGDAALLQLLQRQTPPLSTDLAVDAQLAQAESLILQGKPHDAVASLQTLLQRVQSGGPLDNGQDLVIGLTLGSALRLDGRYAEATAVAQNSVTQHVARLGPDHPQTLAARNLLGALYEQAGDKDKALAEFRNVLAARERVLGVTHPVTLKSAQALASSLVKAGQADEGIARIRDVIEARRLRGEDNAAPNLLAKNVLAYALEDQGKLSDAEAMMRSIIAAQSTAGGPADAEAIGPRNNLAMLLMKQHRTAEALEEFDVLQSWMAGHLQAGHPYFAIIGSNRGECLAQLQRWAEARDALENAHRTLVDKYGETHERSRTAATRLAFVYRKLGMRAKADAMQPAPAP